MTAFIRRRRRRPSGNRGDEGVHGILFRRGRIVPRAGNHGADTRHYRPQGIDTDRGADAEAAIQLHAQVTVIGGGPVGCSVLHRPIRPSGRDVMLLAPERLQLTASCVAQTFPMRWFEAHLPPRGVGVRNVSPERIESRIAGPRARDVLAAAAMTGGASC